MACIEFNALSVITCGSFSAHVFIPEMDKLALDDVSHTKKYPVLWLLHHEGGASMDWLRTPAERCAVKYGIFIIAPDQQHALCTNMAYGPRYEDFMRTELPGICRNNLPISADPALNWIGGVGTGAYGAVKMALKYPACYGKAVAINGVLDLEAICQAAAAGEETGIHHHKASLEAVFGDLNGFAGGEHDLFALAKKGTDKKFLFICEEDNPHARESRRLAELLGPAAEVRTLESGADCDSCQKSLPQGAAWLIEG